MNIFVCLSAFLCFWLLSCLIYTLLVFFIVNVYACISDYDLSNSTPTSFCLCLSYSLFVHLFISRFVYVSLFIFQSFYRTNHLSISVAAYHPICLCLTSCLFAYLSRYNLFRVTLSVYLSVYLFSGLFTCYSACSLRRLL